MKNCYDCNHCEVCKWIDKFKDKDVCDFYENSIPLNEVLDKIRTEIKEMPTISFNKIDVYKADVFAIIDKYTKGESE